MVTVVRHVTAIAPERIKPHCGSTFDCVPAKRTFSQGKKKPLNLIYFCPATACGPIVFAPSGLSSGLRNQTAVKAAKDGCTLESCFA
jgi:hypothetical protein